MQTTFLYHAFALGVGGTLRYPDSSIIHSHASAVLSVHGGAGNGFSGPYRDKNGISFRSASSQVSGSLDRQGNHSTLATATVEGFNIQDVVSFDRVVTRVTSMHPPVASLDGEAMIRTNGSHFEKLKIAGVELDVEFEDRINDHPTLSSFTKAYANDSSFRGDLNAACNWGPTPAGMPPELAERYAWCHSHCDMPNQTGAFTPPSSKGLIMASIVKSIAPRRGNLQTFGNVAVVPGFGKIFLGEISIYYGRRRLTMLRLELGSPLTGDLSLADGETNGSIYP